MKKIIILLSLLLTSVLFSAEIDVKLYENDDKETYYKDIQKQIIADAEAKIRSDELVKSELLHLERLQDTASQKVQIDKYDTKTLEKKEVSLKDLYNAIAAAASMQLKDDQNKKIASDMQAKLLLLKQLIERITEEEKPKLLSYQLQFAYYKIQQKNIEAKNAIIRTDKKELMDKITTAFATLNCDKAELFTEKIVEMDIALEEINKQKVSYKLLQEKATIEESIDLEKINKKLDLARASCQKNLTDKIVLQIQNGICLLKGDNNKDFYKNMQDIESSIALVKAEDKDIYLQQVSILKELSKTHFGATKLFFGATVEESKAILISIYDYIFSPLFVFNEQPISLFSLFKAIFLITLGFVLGMLYKRWLGRISRKWKDISLMSIRLASNIGYYLLVLIFFMISMSSLGIDMSSISLIAGALSIGIGFGLQTIVSNLFAGIILMFERTIRIGDVVEISEVVHGVVTDMRIRSTTVKTFDNIDIVVPNSFFIQNNVTNWTLEDRARRLHIPFSVAYGTEVEAVRSAVLDALEKSQLHYIRRDEDRKPLVRMTLMNSSSVDFELLVWVTWQPVAKNMSVNSDFMILIYDALRANDIAIPFPQLDLYVKEISAKVIDNAKQ